MRTFAGISLALSVCAASALAEDSPELALAKSAVEAHRSDAHRAARRIVWPTDMPPRPPEGAEVVVITGFMSHEITRFVWHDGKVEAVSVADAKAATWNLDGKTYAAREFDVDAVSFARTWGAAMLILGAKDESLDPKQPDAGQMRWGAGSHESVDWLRVSDGSQERLIDAGRQYRNGWKGIAQRATFELFRRLRAPDDRLRPASPETWRPVVEREIDGATRRSSSGLFGEEFLEDCLCLAGEIGDAETLEILASFDATLSPNGDDARDELGLSGVSFLARTALRLRVHWNADEAVRVLHENLEGNVWQRRLASSVRRLFVSRDKERYLELVESDLVNPDALRDDVLGAIASARELVASRAAELITHTLSNREPHVRIDAAVALLEIDPASKAAAAALVSVADDSTLPGARDDRFLHQWSRSRALSEARKRKLLTTADIRGRLAGKPISAHFVKALVYELSRTPDPASSEEVVAAWRNVLEGPPELGLRTAIEELVVYEDRVSRPRLVEALDRLAKAPDDGTTWSDIVRLRAAVKKLQETSDDE